MLAHSFDRFYAVAKSILPTISDLEFSTINYMKHAIIYMRKWMIINLQFSLLNILL